MACADFIRALFGREELKKLWFYTWKKDPDGRGGYTKPYRAGPHCDAPTVERAAFRVPDIYFGRLS